VNASVIEIRAWLTAALTRLRSGSEASRLVAHLRDACNQFLMMSGRPEPGLMPPGPRQALEDLRESFRVTLTYFGTEGKLPEALALAQAVEPGL
jgi:hypothetical protein